MRRLALLSTLLLTLSGTSNDAEAVCQDPAVDAPLASQSVSASALSPTASHPILARTVVAAGSFVHLRELGSLDAIGAPLQLSGAIENTPNPTRMNDNTYGVFVVQQDGIVARDAYDMMQRVMYVSDLKVRDIMIPRSNMVSIEKDDDLDKCLDVMVDSAHSRFPVVDNERDQIIGILLAKDLFL